VYPDARNPFAHPELLEDEGLEPWTVNELWIMAANESNIAVETTKTIDRKVAALLRHESQISDPAGVTERITTGGRAQAEMAGLPPGATAELFRVTRIP
jgi:hypothetical protein